jgi:hypothetical protein
MPRKRKILDPQGNLVDGTLIDIDESTERFSDVKLADGTHIRVRTVIQEIIRFDTLWADNGEPMYNVKSATLPTVVEAPEVLKKPPTKRKDN